MTGETPAGGMTLLAASSTLKWVGGMSGSGTCLTVTTMSIGENVSKTAGLVYGFVGASAAATISAMSCTAKRSSTFRARTPSSNMVTQNGQATATPLASVW